ncbi:hypothetical protein BD770DRAFT_400082 [Pilaira anomala]|nr:hypothetical protein BD770DRAFT_400082 [Pilaira anomala]
MLWKEAKIPIINFTLYKQEDGTINSTRDQIIKSIYVYHHQLIHYLGTKNFRARKDPCHPNQKFKR